VILIIYGFLIEHGVCSNDIWMADHDFGYQIGYAGYPDFFDFLAKVGAQCLGRRVGNRAGRRRGGVASSRFQQLDACRCSIGGGMKTACPV
jgi:hypothetical protein